jgi:uncharacterized membrane protein YkoI
MKFRPLIVVVLAAFTVTGPAFARPHGDERGDRQEKAERPRARISVDQAVSMAERRYNARVVKVETREDGDRVVYVLRLLNDSGRVWTVRVDATSGSMD